MAPERERAETCCGADHRRPPGYRWRCAYSAASPSIPDFQGAFLFIDERTLRLLELWACYRVALAGGFDNVGGRAPHRCDRVYMLGFSQRLGRCQQR
jgi:hypothetical protein